LSPKPNENFIDATIGSGGHALTILEAIQPKGRVLGVDWSEEMIRNIKIKTQNSKLKNNLILVCDSFANLEEIVSQKKFNKVKIHGILFDLGMSSWHLSESGKGFSFQKRELLDMRYNHRNQLTAEKIVNYWSKYENEKILKEYGEEKFARNIAEKIIEERKAKVIKNTLQLVEVIKKAVPKAYLRGRIHFATRTFQALRIVVNNELGNIEKALPQALRVLSSGGHLVVISFHSLEDRIIKNFLKNEAFNLLTKKPIIPTNKEIKINPRSRSAKLRAAIKI